MNIKKRVRMKSWFGKLNACYADGEGGEELPMDDSGNDLPEDVSVEEPAPELVEETPNIKGSDYVGSKDVNPDQRPLKGVDLSDFGSKEELDRFIEEYGPEIFATDEEIAELDKDDSEEVDPEEGPPKEDKEESTDPEVEDEAQAFLKEVNLTKEEFNALPEKVQEHLADSYAESSEEVGKVAEIEKKYTDLKTSVDLLEKDPLILARIEELSSGRQYTAKDLPAPTKEELDTLMDASLDENDFKEALMGWVSSKAQELIKVERSVAEHKANVKRVEEDATKVVQEMIEKEKRIGITDKDPDKLFNHEAWKGEDGLQKFFQKHQLTLVQIKEMGADKLLRLLSVDKGWDKERDKAISKSTKETLLKNLREAKSKARTIDMGKKSPVSRSARAADGYDRDTLVTELAQGTSTKWDELLEVADRKGDKRMIGDLIKIQEEAAAVLREKSVPSKY